MLRQAIVPCRIMQQSETRGTVTSGPMIVSHCHLGADDIVVCNVGTAPADV